MGNPAFCVAWLANKLSAYGVVLKKGEVILSGAISAAATAQRGDLFTAEFSFPGSVSVKFI
jgi:2-keto-4-pentenoate hydratase